ncbi:MAG: hypothetical protein J6S07_02795 [Bacteroidaceae bacterium]|nr:hypothetical protein [Bacteroidaceae bacterium]
MRFPLNIKIDRDERKHILFLGDLFTGTQDLLLTSLVKILGEEYHCTYYPLPKVPRNAVEHISHLCMSDYLRPDLIVACGTAATIACFKSESKIKKVLITPYFSTSTMIANMLPHKQNKTRIELPKLGKPEYLTLTRQMQTEYRQMEEEIYRQGIQNAEALFFSADVDSSIYADYINNFGPAHIMPADKFFSPDAPKCVAKFIREVISAEQVEPMSSEEEVVNDSLPENRPKDELERMEEIHKTLLSKYQAGELERPTSRIRKLVITKSVTPRRELDNKENIHYNTEDMNAFNVIEYLKKESFDIDEYLQILVRAELLSREEEQALVEKAQQGDEEAMSLLLWSNARFVTSLANQYKHKGASIQELLNVAMPVLQKAVLEYDVHNEESLIKYAVPQMREALEKYKKSYLDR